MGTPSASAQKTKDKEDGIIYKSVTRDVRVSLSRYIVTLNALGFPPLLAPPHPPPAPAPSSPRTLRAP